MRALGVAAERSNTNLAQPQANGACCQRDQTEAAALVVQLERYEELAQAVAHGMAIGHQAQCLMAARWEEGWERSISDWRLELGINDPADGAAYGLAA